MLMKLENLHTVMIRVNRVHKVITSHLPGTGRGERGERPPNYRVGATPPLGINSPHVLKGS